MILDKGYIVFQRSGVRGKRVRYLSKEQRWDWFVLLNLANYFTFPGLLADNDLDPYTERDFIYLVDFDNPEQWNELKEKLITVDLMKRDGDYLYLTDYHFYQDRNSNRGKGKKVIDRFHIAYKTLDDDKKLLYQQLIDVFKPKGITVDALQPAPQPAPQPALQLAPQHGPHETLKPTTESTSTCTSTRNNHNHNHNQENKNTLSQTEGLRLADLLFSLILENNPDSRLHATGGEPRKTQIRRWAADIEKLIRIDKQEPSFVEEVIRAAQNDGFWRSNILSGKKLREKWDQLVMKLKKGGGNGGNRGSSGKSFGQAGKTPGDEFPVDVQ